MTTEQNKATMRRFLEASIADDLSAYKDLLAPDFVGHVPGGPKNSEGFIQHTKFYNLAFTDRSITVDDIVAEGDKVIAQIIWSGTHTGDFQGLPPTGKRIEITAFIIERFQDGKSVEHKSFFDQLTMMRQLGLIPEPQPSR